MYSNVGGKLKTLAVFQMIIGSIGGVVSGALLIDTNVSLGIVLILVSPIASWISSLITYGIGEAADNISMAYYSHDCSYSNFKKTERIFHDEEPKYKPQNNNSTSSKNQNSYDYSNAMTELLKNAIEVEVDSHNESFCPKCNAVLSFDGSFGTMICKKCQTAIKVKRSSK